MLFSFFFFCILLALTLFLFQLPSCQALEVQRGTVGSRGISLGMR